MRIVLFAGLVVGALVLLALGGVALAFHSLQPPDLLNRVPLPPLPLPIPEPSPLDHCPGPNCPRRPRPRLAYLPTLVPLGQITIGGPVAPDGRTQVQCDLPLSLRLKNIAGTNGAGQCVFTSICMEARYQNERRLFDFQERMRKEEGGGWPEKVDEMIRKYAPGVAYLQYQGKDPTILAAALASGRMPSVTYCGRDPHYHGQKVAHMVNLVYLDSGQACVLDNNFVGDADLVWMSAAEFLQRWSDGDNGWCVVLLAPSPPPVPRIA